MASPSLQESRSPRLRRVVVPFFGLLVGAAVVGAISWYALHGGPLEYVVVRGDTLSGIAATHGVTLQQLRDWNGIQGDLIEVGQRLVLHVNGDGGIESATGALERGAARGRQSPGSAHERVGLTLPPEKPCLPPPDAGQLDAEGGDEPAFLASRGLSKEQVEAAMGPFLPSLSACIGDGVWPDGVLELELRIACTGRVDRARVLDGGGMPAELGACVADRVRTVSFAAHDLPDGQELRYPVSFTR